MLQLRPRTKVPLMISVHYLHSIVAQSQQRLGSTNLDYAPVCFNFDLGM